MTLAPDPVPGQNLIADVRYLLGGAPRTVIDAGAHHGVTTARYLDEFPNAKVFAFEAEAANFQAAQARLQAYGDRVELVPAAISDVDGDVSLNVNSHDGTHSLFPIGEQRYWAGFAEQVSTRTVPSVRMEAFFAERGVADIDLLHMDIQGGELAALRGAGGLLAGHHIQLVYCEVEFHPLYEGQPLFWDIGAYLHTAGYHLYSLYDRYYHANNPRVLSWADALFVSRTLLELPENKPE